MAGKQPTKRCRATRQNRAVRIHWLPFDNTLEDLRTLVGPFEISWFAVRVKGGKKLMRHEAMNKFSEAGC